MSRGALSVLVVLLVAGAGRAQLLCERPVVALGDVPSGAAVTHRFPLANRGADELRIVEVRSACGCLVPTLEKRRLGPGEETSLGLLVNTLTQAAGPQSWPVRVAFRSGEQEGELTLALTATVVPTVSVEPAGLGIATEAGVQRVITLVDRRRDPLAITVVHTTSTKLRAVQGEPARDAEGRTVYTIRLDVAPDFPEGRHDETLFIFTNDAAFRELKVPVTVFKKLRRLVVVTPENVSVAAAKGEPVPSSLVRLRGPDGDAIEIERVEADHAAVRCTWAVGPNNLATVKVTFDRDKIDGDEVRGAIHVHVAKPAPQTLTIPISCTLR
jgi:hypothetical protein